MPQVVDRLVPAKDKSDGGGSADDLLMEVSIQVRSPSHFFDSVFFAWRMSCRSWVDVVGNRVMLLL